jgi:drug/metabolite transporter (DMT)-like permease
MTISIDEIPAGRQLNKSKGRIMSARFGTYLALVGAVLFWGLSLIGTKIALQFFPPFTLVFLRFGTASLFFLVLIVRKGLPPPPRLRSSLH